MSDVNAAFGAMPRAVRPRIPGRDWAGIVVEGRSSLEDCEVEALEGDLGTRAMGSTAISLPPFVAAQSSAVYRARRDLDLSEFQRV
jgi:hypothetical protein